MRAELTAAARRVSSVLLAAVAASALPGSLCAQCPHGAGQPQRSSVIAWPGFSTAWQNGRYVVAFVDEARRGRLPPAGARLLSCDGESAQQLARKRLDGKPEAAAARLLWDTGERFAPPLPAWCMFETERGQAAYRLEYSAPAAEAMSAALAAAASQRRSLPRLRLF